MIERLEIKEEEIIQWEQKYQHQRKDLAEYLVTDELEYMSNLKLTNAKGLIKMIHATKKELDEKLEEIKVKLEQTEEKLDEAVIDRDVSLKYVNEET